MIEELVRRFDTWRANLPIGVLATLEVIDRDPYPRAAILNAEFGMRVIEVRFWDSGATEVLLAELVTNEVLAEEHRDLGSGESLDQLLGELGEFLKANQ